jgi:cell division initiation protein
MRKDKVITEVLGDETALSPSDIHNQEFSRAVVGGYDRSEVRKFLERIADTVETLVDQIRTLRDDVETAKAASDEYVQIEASLRTALVSSQRFGEEMIEMAKREAHTLIQEARLSRAQAHLEAAKLPGVLSRDIKLLEQQRQRLRIEMLSILETHKRLLDSLIPDVAAKGPTSFFEVGDAPLSRDPAAQAPSYESPTDTETRDDILSVPSPEPLREEKP